MKLEAKVTHKNAILAKCHDCCGGYLDGRKDCGNTSCSLYPYMPYAKKEPNTSWTKYNPKRSGDVLWTDCKVQEGRTMSEGLKRYQAQLAAQKHEDSIESDKFMIEDQILVALERKR